MAFFQLNTPCKSGEFVVYFNRRWCRLILAAFGKAEKFPFAVTLVMINEKEILEKLPGLLPLTPLIAAGAGDDCAVINLPGSEQLLAAADQVIENVHFLPETPPEIVGKKLMNRNLSDIAAMGGVPLTALLTLAVNGKSQEYVERFISGVADAGMFYNVPVCGGDTACLPVPGVCATLTILGSIPHGRAVMRSGAKPGDFVYVTGCIGNSFKSGHHLHFQPRLKEGAFLRELASAMLDISDGLLLDAERLAVSSNVSVVLDLDKVPLRSGAVVPSAFSDGEDYELLFTSPEKITSFPSPEMAQVSCIGQTVPFCGSRLVDKNQSPITMDKTGYVHR